MQRDQDSKTKRSTVVPHQSGAGLEAITFRSAKVSDTDLAIGVSALVLSCEPILPRNARQDDQVKRIKGREHYGPCCIYLGRIGFSLQSPQWVRLSRCRQLRKTRVPKIQH